MANPGRAFTMSLARRGQGLARNRIAPSTFDTDVRIWVTMRRALHIGLFIGTLLGMSACAVVGADDGTRGPYGGVEAGGRQ